MRKTVHFFKPEGKEVEYIRFQKVHILSYIQKKKRVSNFLNRRKKDNRFISYTPINLTKLYDEISNNSEPNHQLCALRMIQKIVKSEYGPTLQQVVKAGILGAVVDLLDLVYEKKFILKATSIIHEFTTNASYIKILVKAGIVTRLTDLLGTSSKHICDNAIQCIANIISTVNNLKNDFAKYGLIEQLVRMLKTRLQSSMANNILSIISYVYQDGKYRFRIFQEIGRLLLSSNSVILVNALTVIKELTDAELECTYILFKSRILDDLLPLLSFENFKVQVLVLLIVGNIAASNENALDLLNEYDTLTYIYYLTHRFGKELRNYIIWCLSNFLSSSPAQIEKVYEADLIPYIVLNFRTGSVRHRMETAICLCNICICGNREQLSTLTNDVVVKEFCELLDFKNEVCTKCILRSLYNMLDEFVEQRRFIVQLIRNSGTLAKLESLLSSSVFDTYNYAFLIINFCEEDESSIRYKRFLKFCQSI